MTHTYTYTHTHILFSSGYKDVLEEATARIHRGPENCTPELGDQWWTQRWLISCQRMFFTRAAPGCLGLLLWKWRVCRIMPHLTSVLSIGSAPTPHPRCEHSPYTLEKISSIPIPTDPFNRNNKLTSQVRPGQWGHVPSAGEFRYNGTYSLMKEWVQ